MVRIALFRGIGFMSSLIRWQTDGRYSHATFLLDNNYIIESWQFAGVRVVKLEDCSNVDIFTIDNLTEEQSDKIIAFCTSQLNKKYDWLGIIRFISRSSLPDNDRWFCSELVFEACKQAGVELLSRIESYNVSPAMLSYSPLLKISSSLLDN